MLRGLLIQFRLRRRINRHVRRMRERMGLRTTRCPVLIVLYAVTGRA